MDIEEKCVQLKKKMFFYVTYLQEFSDEEVGIFVRALSDYYIEQEEPEFGGNLRIIWELIKDKIHHDIWDYLFYE